ncbi:unnamed protein product, partial [Rotaria sp. Silwood1]
YQSRKAALNFFNYKNWFSTKLTHGFPPDDMNSCTIILGAKLVGRRHFLIDPLAALSGARHFFVNYFINQSYYGIIEGGFLGNNFGYSGLSTAHIKPYGWDHGGLQWQVPTRQCEKLIFCLQINTIRYHSFSLSYHFLFGPNSNSFIWWVFNQCSINITPVFVKYPFVGIDYFWTRESPSKDNSL